MNVTIQDSAVFGSVDPLSALGYLENNGWRAVRRDDDSLVVLQKDYPKDRNELIWLPLDRSFRDYGSMLAKAVSTVARAEDVSELSILDDLETVAVGDVVRIVGYDPLDTHANTIQVDLGMSLLDRGKKMLAASASSAVDSRPVHPRRPPNEVRDYLASLRLAQSERGSYRVRIISPTAQPYLLLAPQQALIEGVNLGIPFARRATLALARGLRAAHAAARDNVASGRSYFEPYLSSVPQGVSANLLEAILGDTTNRRGFAPVSVGITWSPTVSDYASPITETFEFSAEMAPFLVDAAHQFRVRHPYTVTLQGWIKLMGRHQQIGAGEIRLLTRVEDAVRQVQVDLSTEDYLIAVQAHGEGRDVQITGELVLEGTRYVLRKPTNLLIIDRPGLFDDLIDDEAHD